jgi:choline dehydrogenase-like flavoprotein
LKSDAEQSLLMRVMGDPRLTLLTNTEAADLIGDPRHPARIMGVRTSDDRRLLGSHVLLAAGALHSPRLLERYLTRNNLAAVLPAANSVGRNLKLHLLTAMVAVSARKQSDLLRKTTVLLNERYPHSSVQPLGFDGELIATLIPRLVPRALASVVGHRAYGFFLQTEDGSDARNRVVDGEGHQPPLLDYDASRIRPAAREHRRFTRAFQRALLGAGLVSFTQRIGLAGTAHVCGTLAAGTDAAHAVVDANGAVFGMPGLHVVDGSVLPRSSRVNPSLTIYAWALRVADRIASRTAASGAGSSINHPRVHHETV